MTEAETSRHEKTQEQAAPVAGVFGFGHGALLIAGTHSAIRGAFVGSSPAPVRALCEDQVSRCRDKGASRCAGTGPCAAAIARAGRFFPVSRGILPTQAQPACPEPRAARLFSLRARRHSPQ